MSKFKVGDTAVCVNINSNIGCISIGELTIGKQYRIAKISDSGDFVHVTNDRGHQFGYFEFRFAPGFTADCCVKCTDSSGSDLTEGRFYTVRDITDGGALILHGSDSRPYRRDRFALADNSEWVQQSGDNFTFSPPLNPAGWDIVVDDTDPAVPVVKMARLQFKVGDRVYRYKCLTELIITGVSGIYADVIGDSLSWCVNQDYLRPAKPLKIGDRVTCIKENLNDVASLGEVGNVTAIAGYRIRTTCKPHHWVPASLYVRKPA